MQPTNADPDVFPPVSAGNLRCAAVEHAINQALPDGWIAVRGTQSAEFRRTMKIGTPKVDWTIRCAQHDLGHFDIRLTDDLEKLVVIHSTDIHCFPPMIEEATLVWFDAWKVSGLTELLRELLTKRRPNLVHPT